MKTLIIIPAFNEEESILNVINTIKKLNEDVDILVVNDCSTDNTEAILLESHINHVSLPINLGIGGAVQTGYKYAKINEYDIAIQIDGDGQHNPKYIVDLIKPILQNKADMVIGSRFIEKKGFQSTLVRRIGIFFFQVVNSILIRQRITDNTSGFRAVNKPLISLFSISYPTDYPEPESIITIAKSGYKIKEIPVIMDERDGGISSIRGFKSAHYMLKVFLSIIITFIRGGK